MTGILVLVATLVVASGIGLTMRTRNGRLRPASETTSGTAATGEPGIDLRPFGAEPGPRATLLQFSSAFCAPCRATRTTLSGIAGTVPGVRHVEIDVADGDAALELVRRLDIRRTPTTLVLDAGGHEVRRASGAPRREQVLTALSDVAGTDPATDSPSAAVSEGSSDVR